MKNYVWRFWLSGCRWPHELLLLATSAPFPIPFKPHPFDLHCGPFPCWRDVNTSPPRTTSNAIVNSSNPQISNSAERAQSNIKCLSGSYCPHYLATAEWAALNNLITTASSLPINNSKRAFSVPCVSGVGILHTKIEGFCHSVHTCTGLMYTSVVMETTEEDYEPECVMNLSTTGS